MTTDTDEPITFREIAVESVDNCGHAFSCATISGCCYFFVQGAYLGIRGKRFKNGLFHCRDRATLMAGGIAMWSLSFNSMKGGF